MTTMPRRQGIQDNYFGQKFDHFGKIISPKA
jgi:hypothetical protein